MLHDSPGPSAVSRVSAGNPQELPDLMGSLLPGTPTAMALLGVSPQELELLAHRTDKSKAGIVEQLSQLLLSAHKAI